MREKERETDIWHRGRLEVVGVRREIGDIGGKCAVVRDGCWDIV